MITDSDIKKMRRVFATKEDLEKMRKEFRAEFVNKKDFHTSVDDLVKLISGGFERVDKAIVRLEEHSDILNNHEHRLDKLDDKIFSPV